MYRNIEVYRSATKLILDNAFCILATLQREKRKDIHTDRTPLVSHSMMDPGQGCLALNAGQESDSGPRMGRLVFVQ